MDTENAGCSYIQAHSNPTCSHTQERKKKKNQSGCGNPRSSTSGVPPTQLVLQGVPVLQTQKHQHAKLIPNTVHQDKEPRVHASDTSGAPSAGGADCPSNFPNLQLAPGLSSPGRQACGSRKSKETNWELQATGQTSELPCEGCNWCSGYNPIQHVQGVAVPTPLSPSRGPQQPEGLAS